MVEQPDRQPTDLLQIWRDWLTQTERQWNSFFNEVMGTDSFARTMGGYLQVYSGFQRLLAESTERYLSYLNVPTRSDLLDVGERLSALDQRLSRVEAKLDALAAGQPGGNQPATGAAARPRRTRRPRPASA